MNIIEKILEKKHPKGTLLIKFFAVAMKYYRQPLGDRAWEEIGKIFGDESLTQGFSFLTGMLMGSKGAISFEGLDKFIEEELKDG